MEEKGQETKSGKRWERPPIEVQCAICLFGIKNPDGLTDEEQRLFTNHICLKPDGTVYSMAERVDLTLLFFEEEEASGVQWSSMIDWIMVRRKHGIDTIH